MGPSTFVIRSLSLCGCCGPARSIIPASCVRTTHRLAGKPLIGRTGECDPVRLHLRRTHKICLRWARQLIPCLVYLDHRPKVLPATIGLQIGDGILRRWCSCNPATSEHSSEGDLGRSVTIDIGRPNAGPLLRRVSLLGYQPLRCCFVAWRPNLESWRISGALAIFRKCTMLLDK